MACGAAARGGVAARRTARARPGVVARRATRVATRARVGGRGNDSCRTDRASGAEALTGRRGALLGLVSVGAAALGGAGRAAADGGAGAQAGAPLWAEVKAADDVQLEALAARAKEAYASRQLPEALAALDEAIMTSPDDAVWYERRGQCLVDLKRFDEALRDFRRAEDLYPPEYVSIGLIGNKALAHEGLAQWEDAVANYSRAIEASEATGAAPPYLYNARGNCRVALAQYDEALADFDESSRLFQAARNVAGLIYADSNAALVAAQLGRDDALRRMEGVARKAPGSVDMRAALAAMYYDQGELERAEEVWEWACTRINTGQLYGPDGPVFDGCAAYRDPDWLTRIRRWPPVMVERMGAFVSLGGGASR